MATAPVRRRTQAERREETRSRILEAAVSELKRKGYAGFRVDKVATTAKVSRGAQTHHFPTKESLVLAALQHLYEASTATSMKLIDALLPEDDILKALMEDAAKFYFGPTFSIAVSMLNLGEHEPELRQKVRALSRKHRFPIEQAWLNALIRSGLAEEAANTVLSITHSIYRGMVMRRFLRNDAQYTKFTIEQWERIARTYMDTRTPRG